MGLLSLINIYKLTYILKFVMPYDTINQWAKHTQANAKTGARVNGAKAAQFSGQGNLILEIAEKLRPHLTKLFKDARDENGMLVQPARIRGIALNVAQSIVRENNTAHA